VDSLQDLQRYEDALRQGQLAGVYNGAAV
jgi:hypothetical protein